MRILVLSDSHGSTANVRAAIMREQSSEIIIHLGDGAEDILMCSEAVGARRVIQLKGNVDSVLSGAVEKFSAPINGVNVFACHGDRYAVRSGTALLEDIAASEKAGIVLFGHTHIPYYNYTSERYIINPGSIKEGNYAVIELRKEGVLCNHKQI